mmetsp:Transcript_31315/g.30155  ORF Transcript_31315/g.30155 Transcript_31315/m.30155 type:complete len:144 (-) Transcript_31315:174-605(-)
MSLAASKAVRGAISTCASRTHLLRKSSFRHAGMINARFMSVVTLSDEAAIEKFRAINNKSILYFTATWCPPCKIISPIYNEFSKEHTEVAFGKVDIDDNGDAAASFKINAVPTFVLFNGDTVTKRFSGNSVELEKNIIELKNL